MLANTSALLWRTSKSYCLVWISLSFVSQFMCFNITWPFLSTFNSHLAISLEHSLVLSPVLYIHLPSDILKGGLWICKHAVIASVCLVCSQEVDQSVELFCGPCWEPGSYRATVCGLESLQVSFLFHCAVSDPLFEVSTGSYLLSEIAFRGAWLNLSFIWQCKWKSNSKKKHFWNHSLLYLNKHTGLLDIHMNPSKANSIKSVVQIHFWYGKPIYSPACLLHNKITCIHMQHIYCSVSS